MKNRIFTVILSLILFSVYKNSIAVELQKPSEYTGTESIENWVMSEKLDGIRAFWDGENLYTRKGKKIIAPEWFVANYPNFALDGELWSGRNEFEFILSTVLDKTPGSDWRRITYNIFETPNQAGGFLDRLEIVRDWFAVHQNSSVRVIPQIRCENRDHLNRFLDGIISLGGEGVIIKDPTQAYHTGRSSYSLKVKKFEDMEGTVVAINPGRGKYESMMGSLTLKLENGLEFKLGTGFSNTQRKNPPAIGSVVTFKYYGFTKKGIPKFASFIRVRGD